jgi:phospholipid transport system substrate-binding protein
MRKLLQFVGAFTRVALVAALALFSSVLTNLDSASAAVATTPVEDFVQQNVDKGYNLLKNKSFSDAERHARFHTFMLSISDMRRIGMFALGQYANRLSKAETDVYIAAFADYAIPVYETWLSKYNERTLKVTGAVQRAPDDFVVSADAVSITNQSAQPFKVSFRLRKAADGRFIVTDMTGEGISLALTLRSDFTAFLQQHGDRISDLVARLKGQTETIHSGGAAMSSAR